MAYFGPISLADGDAITVDVGFGVRLTIITDGTATATYSRVNGGELEEHDSSTTDIVASTVEAIDVDWPYYRISAAGGTVRVAVV